jgi:hypothetical protein
MGAVIIATVVTGLIFSIGFLLGFLFFISHTQRIQKLIIYVMAVETAIVLPVIVAYELWVGSLLVLLLAFFIPYLWKMTFGRDGEI